jgi:hypothetical protein
MVKMSKKIKSMSVWFLILSLVLSGTLFLEVRAARGVETNRKCSVTFEIGGDLAGDFEELSELSIPVKLYKVADISETGTYKAVKGYESLDFDSVTSETTAAQWEQKAQMAQKIIEDEQKAPAAEGVIENGKGKISDVAVGMYLVAAEAVLSPEYEYQFTPYLLSLPNNYHSTTGNDDWVYDVTTGLKPSQETRFGSLVIDKTVTSFNETLGSATFVFQIEGVKDGEKVYSDVVSAVFDTAGTKSILVDKIPAGTEVTVTEIYSGASYELIGAPSQTVIIKASGEGEESVHVTFTNEYNEKLNGGASVVNHFANEDGVWTVDQQSDSTKAGE